MLVDSMGSCVPRSVGSIVLDHQSFVETGGNLKRARWFNYIYNPFFNIPLSRCIISV